MNCSLKLRQKRRANSKNWCAKRWKGYTSLPCRWSWRSLLAPIGGLWSEPRLLRHHQLDSRYKIRKKTRRPARRIQPSRKTIEPALPVEVYTRFGYEQEATPPSLDLRFVVRRT